MAEKKGFIDDATDVMINEVMPKAVKWLLDKIPEDRYEEIFQDKKKYWDIALPFFSFAVLRTTNAPKIVDDLTTEFFAEVRREINRRAEESPQEEGEKDKKKEEQKSSGELIGITYAKTATELRRTMSDRLNRLVDEEEKVALFKVSLPPKDAQQIIKNLVACDEDEFSELVSILISQKKKRVEPSKRINIVAEMAKHPELLEKLSGLTEEEKRATLIHLSELPASQLTEHLQTLSKMDDPHFRLYIDTMMEMDRQRILPQAKKIGGGVWGEFKRWLKEGKKVEEDKSLSESLSEAFKAGKIWRLDK